MPRSSTEPRLAQAWPLERLTAEELAGVLKLTPAQARQRVDELGAHGSDPAWCARELARLPAPALLLIAILGDEHGLVLESQLYARAGRLGVAEMTARRALMALVHAALAVPLRVGWGDEPSIALVDPPGASLAEAVRGLDVPTVPPGELPAGPGDDGRVLLATCAALAQVDVKLTAEGRPHRTALRKLAKAVGLAEDTLDEVIAAAHGAGLLVLDEGDVLRPVWPALRGAAAGEYATGTALAALVERLARAGGPVALAAVEQWQRGLVRGGFPMVRPSPLERLAWLPQLRVGALDAVPAVARAPARATTAAATVTPSFEVILPPETTGPALVDVLACTDVTRIDRAITAKLTRPSVARAAASGLDAGAQLAALARACRTPVPQNVEVAIREWAGGARAVTAEGRVIVVPAADAERALGALAAWGPAELAPGVIVVGSGRSARDVTAALARIGITCAAPVTAAPARATAASFPALPTTSAGAAYRARLEAWRAGDPAERARLEPTAVAPPEDELPPDVIGALEAWERRTGVSLTDDEFRALGTALEHLTPRERTQMLRSPDLHRVVRDLLAAPHSAPVPAELRADLAGAARRGDRVTLGLARGGTLEIVPSQVIQRGAAWLVLGEGDDGEGIAVPLADVRSAAIARTDARGPWRPREGEPVPAGHVRCPCGSGERYRSCCRPTASA